MNSEQPFVNRLACVINADGSIAEMCGNGLRCVVAHLARTAGGHPPAVNVETGAGLLTSQV